MSSIFTHIALALACVAQEMPEVRTAEQARALPRDTQAVAVRLEDVSVLEALLGRCPDIARLEIDNPGNKIQLASLEILERWPELEHLELRGDPFLYDEEFAALGRLGGLVTLDLALP